MHFFRGAQIALHSNSKMPCVMGCLRRFVSHYFDRFFYTSFQTIRARAEAESRERILLPSFDLPNFTWIGTNSIRVQQPTSLFVWLKSHDWKYYSLICCTKKTLFVGWKSMTYKTSEQSVHLSFGIVSTLPNHSFVWSVTLYGASSVKCQPSLTARKMCSRVHAASRVHSARKMWILFTGRRRLSSLELYTGRWTIWQSQSRHVMPCVMGCLRRFVSQALV
jgi:hypothetical protein